MPLATDLDLGPMTSEELEILQLRIGVELLQRQTEAAPATNGTQAHGKPEPEPWPKEIFNPEFLVELDRRINDPNKVLLTPDEFLAELDEMWARQDAGLPVPDEFKDYRPRSCSAGPVGRS